MRFLSKAEVGQWPVIGWLARQAGTLFIKRGGGQARAIKASIAQCLQAGESVMVYPEGTTSTGVAVLPMHGLLMSAAHLAGVTGLLSLDYRSWKASARIIHGSAGSDKLSRVRFHNLTT